MEDNYAIVDDDGVVSDGFETIEDAEKEYQENMNAYCFHYKGKVILVKIVAYLS